MLKLEDYRLTTPPQVIDITSTRIVLFHTTHFTFQVQTETMGTFPKNISWYFLLPFPRLPASRGRPKKNSSIPSGTYTTLDTRSSSALLCGWVPYSEDELVPELWQYLPPPAEEFRCLNVREEISVLDLDLQHCIVVGGRLILLGTTCEREKEDAVYNLSAELILS